MAVETAVPGVTERAANAIGTVEAGIDGAISEGVAAEFKEAMDAALNTNLSTGLVGLVMGTSTLGLTYYICRDVPTHLMSIWATLSIALMIFWAGVCVWLFYRDISRPHLAGLWARIVGGMLIVGNGLLALSVWLFFPSLTYEQRLSMALLQVAMIPAQVVCCPGNVVINRSATVALLGSLIFFFVRIDGARAIAPVIFLFALAGMMLVASGFVQIRLRDSVLLTLASNTLSRKLEAALISVSKARDAKAQFIAAASHDLGQPLQAAALFFDQALRAPQTAAGKLAADRVRQALASADGIIAQMLDFMRLEAGAIRDVHAPVDVAPLLARLIAQFAPAAAGSGIRIYTAGRPVRLTTDGLLLERALANLIGNAINHSRGARLLVFARRGRDGWVRFYVIDDGRGIAPADADHIFDDYYRGIGNAGETGGFGLGLASVRRIAGLLGGAADLDPRWKRGAAFFLKLPCEAAQQVG